MRVRSAAVALLAAALCITSANADMPPLKVGWIATFSGGYTTGSKVADAAVAAFIKEHGDSVAGRKLEIIKRDDGGLAPDTAKRLAQELIVGDKVDFLMGITYSPNAMAIGPISTSIKKPLLITNGAANGLLQPNPYYSRFSYTEGQLTQTLAQWALKNNIKTAYMAFLDFATGIDAAEGFQASYTAGGGKILGEVRIPVSSSDFSAYVQRIKDAKPQAVFVFLTVSGGPFLKAWVAAGGPQSGMKILGTGDLTNEANLPGLGDNAIGVITSMNYSAVHNSALNAQLTRDMRAADPTVDVPDFGSVATYDALQAIYRIVAAQKGGSDPDKAMATLKGMKFESPRGPIAIDPVTRDIVENIYIRRVDKVGDRYQNTEIATFPNVRDPLEK
jgi:branched-chain amino acid transport system substrate-binding protein